jgi:GT2 family glycosyltransferase
MEQTDMSSISVVVVPRQRWSFAERSLATVLEHLPDGVQLVYVDGGSPPHISRRLEAAVGEVSGVWIRRDCVLAGNEARNLGVEAATGRYVVFVDNDVVPRAGWLEALVSCADETGAAAVGPIILQGRDESTAVVHSADGDLIIDDGVLTHVQRHVLEDLDQAVEAVGRRRTDQLEFHTMLVRREVLDQLGPLDEELKSMGDHEDLMLSIRQAGGEAWVDAASVVAYLTMVPLDPGEVAYWQLRWSEQWNRGSVERFAEKWGLDIDAGWPAGAARWASAERTRWYHGRSRLHHHAGRALRRAFNTPVLSDPCRRFEQRVVSRRCVDEVTRRQAVLGHD